MNLRTAKTMLCLFSLILWVVSQNIKAADTPPAMPSELTALPEVANIAATNEIFIVISFTTNLDPATASNASNYQLNGNLSIVDAFAVGSFVQLQVRPMEPGQAYELTLNGISDLEGNTILPNTKIGFRYGEYGQLAITG